MKDVETPRDRILDRTIYLIGKKGTTSVSVREIAREAGVNVAAINYYFSSKEQMLAQMEERFVGAFAEVVAMLHDPTRPPYERLLHWADEAMRYLLEYPGVLVLIDAKVSGDDVGDFGTSLRLILDGLYAELRRLLGEVIGCEDDEELAFKTTVLTSAVVQPVSLSALFATDREALLDGETRRLFVRRLLALLS